MPTTFRGGAGSGSSDSKRGDLGSVLASGWRRRRRKNASSAATETAVAVRKYAKADFPLS